MSERKRKAATSSKAVSDLVVTLDAINSEFRYIMQAVRCPLHFKSRRDLVLLLTVFPNAAIITRVKPRISELAASKDVERRTSASVEDDLLQLATLAQKFKEQRAIPGVNASAEQTDALDREGA